VHKEVQIPLVHGEVSEGLVAEVGRELIEQSEKNSVGRYHFACSGYKRKRNMPVHMQVCAYTEKCHISRSVWK
jgi:hypothetical protein